MAHEVRAVVACGKGAPVTVETVQVPDPGPGEALVTVQACGVCHTDLHYREGGINDDFPFLLGHEAAGIVDAVGDGVSDVQPGDFVILNWRAVCGRCRACTRGQPWYCFDTHNAAQPMTLPDGTALSPALGIGAFAEKTLVHSGQCTKVNPAVRPEVAGLLGCGVMAGLGAAINTRAGDARAVCRRDRLRRGRRRGDRRCGPRRREDGDRGGHRSAQARMGQAVRRDAHGEQPRDRPGGGRAGAHRWVRRRRGDRRGGPTGDLEAGVLRPRLGRHRGAGRSTHPRHAAGAAADRLLRPRRVAESSWYGDCLPERDFPMLVDPHLQGRLPLERFVSETVGLDDVEQAFEKMEHGEVLRSVVLL